MKKIAGAFILLISLNSSFGQQIVKCDSIKSLWIIENENRIYSLTISGKVSSTERKNLISVNDYALQYLLVDKDKFTTTGKTQTDLEILVNYVSDEIRYISGQFNLKLEAQMQKAPLSPEKDVLLWWYKMPDGMNEQVTHQLFACLITDNSIFGIACPQFTDQHFDKIRDFLMDTISTLKSVDNMAELNDICGQK